MHLPARSDHPHASATELPTTRYRDYVERVLERRSQLSGELDVDAMLIVMGSVRLGHLLSTSSDTHVHRPAGSTFSRFRILFALWLLGPQSVTELARTFDISQPTVSGLLDGLESSGLATRDTDPDDRRSRIARITDRGAALTEQSLDAQDRHERQLLAHLTATERQQLASLLTKALSGHTAG